MYMYMYIHPYAHAHTQPNRSVVLTDGTIKVENQLRGMVPSFDWDGFFAGRLMRVCMHLDVYVIIIDVFVPGL